MVWKETEQYSHLNTIPNQQWFENTLNNTHTSTQYLINNGLKLDTEQYPHLNTVPA